MLPFKIKAIFNILVQDGLIYKFSTLFKSMVLYKSETDQVFFYKITARFKNVHSILDFKL